MKKFMHKEQIQMQVNLKSWGKFENFNSNTNHYNYKQVWEELKKKNIFKILS